MNKFKIVHITMVDEFTEGWAYHRNIISEKNKADGHDVTIITTKYKMGNEGESVLEGSGISYTKSGIKVVRLKDGFPLIPRHIQDFLHCTRGLYRAIKNENPDIIMVHNLQFFNLYEVTKYKRLHPKVRLLGDTHAFKDNSIRTHTQRAIFLHKTIIRRNIQKNFRYFDRFAYISVYEKEFFEKMYAISMHNAYLLPLPASIVDRREKAMIREKIRNSLNLAKDTLLLVHSGKLTDDKKTELIFQALRNNEINCKLLIIGKIPDGRKQVINKYVKSEHRAEFLGWMESSKLQEYIAAADLYLQPGGPSVTMSNALAAGTPVMVYPWKSYKEFSRGAEFFIKSVEDINDVFNAIKSTPQILNLMSIKAYEAANELFSIERNAAFVYGNLI